MCVCVCLFKAQDQPHAQLTQIAWMRRFLDITADITHHRQSVTHHTCHMSHFAYHTSHLCALVTPPLVTTAAV
jgi:hypothetical protein